MANFTVALLIFLEQTAKESILDKSVIAEFLWKNTLVCTALEVSIVRRDNYGTVKMMG